MRVIDKTYFNEYKIQIKNVANKLATFLSTSIKQELEYQLNVSVVYSSNIEGNSLDINSITKEISFTKKRNEAEEIKSLVNTHNLAQKNELNSFNFLKIHALSSQTFLIKDKRGVYRTDRESYYKHIALGKDYCSLDSKLHIFSLLMLPKLLQA